MLGFHLHALCRYRPHGVVQVKLRPLRSNQFVGSYKSQRQSQTPVTLAVRVGPEIQAITVMQLANTGSVAFGVEAGRSGKQIRRHRGNFSPR